MHINEILESCWSGYTQKGMKKKGDHMVPNCVPVNENTTEKYILYLNHKPVFSYSTAQEAEYQGLDLSQHGETAYEVAN